MAAVSRQGQRGLKTVGSGSQCLPFGSSGAKCAFTMRMDRSFLDSGIFAGLCSSKNWPNGPALGRKLVFCRRKKPRGILRLHQLIQNSKLHVLSIRSLGMDNCVSAGQGVIFSWREEAGDVHLGYTPTLSNVSVWLHGRQKKKM